MPVRPLRTIKPGGVGGGGEPSSLALSPSPLPVRTGLLLAQTVAVRALSLDERVAIHQRWRSMKRVVFFGFFLATVAKEFVLATELQNKYVLATVLQNHSYQGIPNKRKQRLKMCLWSTSAEGNLFISNDS